MFTYLSILICKYTYIYYAYVCVFVHVLHLRIIMSKSPSCRSKLQGTSREFFQDQMGLTKKDGGWPMKMWTNVVNNLAAKYFVIPRMNDPLPKTVPFVWSPGLISWPIPLKPARLLWQPDTFDGRPEIAASAWSGRAPIFLNRFTMICHPFNSIKNI